jgi:cell division protein FtsB
MKLGLWTGSYSLKGTRFTMGMISELKARARFIAGPVLGMMVLTYFGYHVVNGDRGLNAWWQLKDRIETAYVVLDAIQVERKILENRVHLLHPESLDPDMLEERARVMLNYGHADDIVAIDKSTKE